MSNRHFPVGIWAGITIAMIGSAQPVVAVPDPAPRFVAQVACVVNKQTPVFKNANPGDSEALPIRPLAVGTPVVFVSPLPANPPARVQINQPTNGFVDYAALNCGGKPPESAQASVCRKVRSTLNPIYVFREPSWGAQPIDRDAAVVANQSVYVLQTGDSVIFRQDVNGGVWVKVDLQRTFGKNFGLSPRFGWLPNTDPNDPQSSALVYGCN